MQSTKSSGQFLAWLLFQGLGYIPVGGGWTPDFGPHQQEIIAMGFATTTTGFWGTLGWIASKTDLRATLHFDASKGDLKKTPTPPLLKKIVKFICSTAWVFCMASYSVELSPLWNFWSCFDLTDFSWFERREYFSQISCCFGIRATKNSNGRKKKVLVFPGKIPWRFMDLFHPAMFVLMSGVFV